MQTTIEPKSDSSSEPPHPAPTTSLPAPHGNGAAANAQLHGNGNGNGNGNGAPKPWSAAESEKLYSVKSWGSGYFSVNADGHVAVHPTCDPNISIDLKKLIDELRERDIQLPMLVRFTDILK